MSPEMKWLCHLKYRYFFSGPMKIFNNRSLNSGESASMHSRVDSRHWTVIISDAEGVSGKI